MVAAAGHGLVLIVEDDADSADVLRAILRLEGIRSLAARNGKVALGVLDLVVPSVIVLDLRMPHMDGWAFERERRRRPELRDIPVVVVSAVDPPEALRGGVEPRYFLRKPVDVDLFVRVVQSLVFGTPLPAADRRSASYGSV